VVSLILILTVFEVAVHVISFIRFHKESSTHHYMSKLFSILLFGLIGQLFIFPEVTAFYWLTMGLGILSFLESGLIMLTIPKWKTDIRPYWDVLLEKKITVSLGEK